MRDIREEDLLALQQELLGPMPLELAQRGRLFDQLMTADGRLRRIPSVSARAQMGGGERGGWAGGGGRGERGRGRGPGGA